MCVDDSSTDVTN